uniref:E3 ubiquitin-protein ligase RBBP6 isoform X2 n=1 Tax=Myxine glutinosa TaxID=7769 RepID=UPI00359014E9
MSCVHYKFSSKLNYDTVTFDGMHISLADLKKTIMSRERLKAADCDLQITNAQTKEEYFEDGALIPKNSSVIVKRIPIGGVRAVSKAYLADRSDSSASKDIGRKWTNQHRIWDLNRGCQRPDQSVPKEAVDAAASSLAMARLTKTANLAEVNASEEDKIKAMMSQSGQDYDPINYVKKPTGPPPSTYTCYRCLKPGHHIKNCALYAADKAPEMIARIKKSTGIPLSFMVEVDDPHVKGAMLTSTGKYAIPTIDAEAYALGKKEKPPFVQGSSSSSSEEEDPVPDELLCLLCKDLMSDAVVIPCCGNSYCDECIRTALLDSEDHTCPTCHQCDVSPDALISNKVLRQAVGNFRNETGYIKKRRKNAGPNQSKAVVPAHPAEFQQNSPTAEPSGIAPDMSGTLTGPPEMTEKGAVEETEENSQPSDSTLAPKVDSTNTATQADGILPTSSFDPGVHHRSRGSMNRSAHYSRSSMQMARNARCMMDRIPPAHLQIPPFSMMPLPMPPAYAHLQSHSLYQQIPAVSLAATLPLPLQYPPHYQSQVPVVAPMSYPIQQQPTQTTYALAVPPGLPSGWGPQPPPSVPPSSTNMLPPNMTQPPAVGKELYHEQRRLNEEESKKSKLDEMTDDFAKELLEYKKIQRDRHRSRSRCHSKSRSPSSSSSYSRSSYSTSRSRSLSRSRSRSRSHSRSRTPRSYSRSRSYSCSPGYNRRTTRPRGYRSRSRSYGGGKGRYKSRSPPLPRGNYRSHSRSPRPSTPPCIPHQAHQFAPPHNFRRLPLLSGNQYDHEYFELYNNLCRDYYKRGCDPYDREFHEWERKFSEWHKEYYGDSSELFQLPRINSSGQPGGPLPPGTFGPCRDRHNFPLTDRHGNQQNRHGPLLPERHGPLLPERHGPLLPERHGPLISERHGPPPDRHGPPPLDRHGGPPFPSFQHIHGPPFGRRDRSYVRPRPNDFAHGCGKIPLHLPLQAKPLHEMMSLQKGGPNTESLLALPDKFTRKAMHMPLFLLPQPLGKDMPAFPMLPKVPFKGMRPLMQFTVPQHSKIIGNSIGGVIKSGARGRGAIGLNSGNNPVGHTVSSSSTVSSQLTGANSSSASGNPAEGGRGRSRSKSESKHKKHHKRRRDSGSERESGRHGNSKLSRCIGKKDDNIQKKGEKLLPPPSSRDATPVRDEPMDDRPYKSSNSQDGQDRGKRARSRSDKVKHKDLSSDRKISKQSHPKEQAKWHDRHLEKPVDDKTEERKDSRKSVCSKGSPSMSGKKEIPLDAEKKNIKSEWEGHGTSRGTDERVEYSSERNRKSKKEKMRKIKESSEKKDKSAKRSTQRPSSDKAEKRKRKVEEGSMQKCSPMNRLPSPKTESSVKDILLEAKGNAEGKEKDSKVDKKTVGIEGTFPRKIRINRDSGRKLSSEKSGLAERVSMAPMHDTPGDASDKVPVRTDNSSQEKKAEELRRVVVKTIEEFNNDLTPSTADEIVMVHIPRSKWEIEEDDDEEDVGRGVAKAGLASSKPTGGVVPPLRIVRPPLSASDQVEDTVVGIEEPIKAEAEKELLKTDNSLEEPGKVEDMGDTTGKIESSQLDKGSMIAMEREGQKEILQEASQGRKECQLPDSQNDENMDECKHKLETIAQPSNESEKAVGGNEAEHATSRSDDQDESKKNNRGKEPLEIVKVPPTQSILLKEEVRDKHSPHESNKASKRLQKIEQDDKTRKSERARTPDVYLGSASAVCLTAKPHREAALAGDKASKTDREESSHRLRKKTPDRNFSHKRKKESEKKSVSDLPPNKQRGIKPFERMSSIKGLGVTAPQDPSRSVDEACFEPDYNEIDSENNSSASERADDPTASASAHVEYNAELQTLKQKPSQSSASHSSSTDISDESQQRRKRKEKKHHKKHKKHKKHKEHRRHGDTELDNKGQKHKHRKKKTKKNKHKEKEKE